MTPRRFTFFLGIAFVLAACIHAILITRGFFGISADESGRTLDALAWSTSGTPQSDVWLPFHRIMLVCGLWIDPDLFIVPRIVSFIFGLLAIAALVWLTHEIFHDRIVTISSAYLAALFPMRVVLAVVPLSEIEFITLLAAGFASFVHWHNSRRPWFLLLSASLAGLSTSVRYEGWIFAGAIGAFFLFSADTRRFFMTKPITATCVVALLMVFPLYWIIHTDRETGIPFEFAASAITQYEKSADPSVVKLIWRNPLTQFLYQNALTLNLVGAVSIVGLWSSRKQVQPLMLISLPALAAMALLAFFGKALPTHNPWRVAAAWSYLLVPFTAYWIVHDAKKVIPTVSWLRIGVPIAVLAAFFIQIGMMTRAPFFSHSERALGVFLRTALADDKSPSARVLIETSDWSYVNIMLSSNVPDRFIYNTGFEPYHPIAPVLDPRNPVRMHDLLGKGIRLLVFKSELFWNPSGQASARKLECLNGWCIYEISENEARDAIPPQGGDGTHSSTHSDQ